MESVKHTRTKCEPHIKTITKAKKTLTPSGGQLGNAKALISVT